jgi:hypothetical protein
VGGRSSGTPGDVGGPRRADACELLRIETHLMSPQAEALKTVRTGDSLPLGLQQIETHRFVVVLNSSGQVVGTVGSDQAINLIECMDKGFVYTAEILSIDGGACRTLIHLEGR